MYKICNNNRYKFHGFKFMTHHIDLVVLLLEQSSVYNVVDETP